jgi:transposase-like protein
MAKDYRRFDVELAQEVLPDDSGFLCQIVERVGQQMLDTEMTEHVGAVLYDRSVTRTGQCDSHKPRALRSRVGTLNLLVPQDRKAPSPRGCSRVTRKTRRHLCWRR